VHIDAVTRAYRNAATNARVAVETNRDRIYLIDTGFLLLLLLWYMWSLPANVWARRATRVSTAFRLRARRAYGANTSQRPTSSTHNVQLMYVSLRRLASNISFWPVCFF
jgi:hypothetical protein